MIQLNKTNEAMKKQEEFKKEHPRASKRLVPQVGSDLFSQSAGALVYSTQVWVSREEINQSNQPNRSNQPINETIKRQEESKEECPDKHAEAWKTLESVDGVVLPGGFGTRGVEGKILTAK